MSPTRSWQRELNHLEARDVARAEQLTREAFKLSPRNHVVPMGVEMAERGGHEASESGPLLPLMHAVAHVAQLERDYGMVREKLLLNPGKELSESTIDLMRDIASHARRMADVFDALVIVVSSPAMPHQMSEDEILREHEDGESRVVDEHDTREPESSRDQFRRAQREGTTIGHQWPKRERGE